MANDIYKKLSDLQYFCNKSNKKHQRPRKADLCTYTGLLDVCNPCLRETGLVLKFDEAIRNIGGCNYLECSARLTDVDTEDEIESIALVEIGNKATEKARYHALSALLLLDDYKIEHDNTTKYTEKDINAVLRMHNLEKISESERKTLIKAMDKRGVTEKDVLDFCKVDTLDCITKGQYQRLLVKISIT